MAFNLVDRLRLLQGLLGGAAGVARGMLPPAPQLPSGSDLASLALAGLIEAGQRAGIVPQSSPLSSSSPPPVSPATAARVPPPTPPSGIVGNPLANVAQGERKRPEATPATRRHASRVTGKRQREQGPPRTFQQAIMNPPAYLSYIDQARAQQAMADPLALGALLLSAQTGQRLTPQDVRRQVNWADLGLLQSAALYNAQGRQPVPAIPGSPAAQAGGIDPALVWADYALRNLLQTGQVAERSQVPQPLFGPTRVVAPPPEEGGEPVTTTDEIVTANDPGMIRLQVQRALDPTTEVGDLLMIAFSDAEAGRVPEELQLVRPADVYWELVFLPALSRLGASEEEIERRKAGFNNMVSLWEQSRERGDPRPFPTWLVENGFDPLWGLA